MGVSTKTSMLRSAFCGAPLCSRTWDRSRRYRMTLRIVKLVASLNVFGKGGGDCVFLGFVMTYAAGLLDQFVIESEIGCHV